MRATCRQLPRWLEIDASSHVYARASLDVKTITMKGMSNELTTIVHMTNGNSRGILDRAEPTLMKIRGSNPHRADGVATDRVGIITPN